MTDLNRLAAIAALVVLGYAGPAFAQERREVPAFSVLGEAACPLQAAEIDTFLSDYWDAWGNQDVDRLRTYHADDMEWINAYARMFQNADDLAAFMRDRLFPAFDPAVSRQEVANARAVSIRYLGPNAAIAHYYTDSARGPSQNDGEALRRTHFHLVIERQNDSWQVVHTVIMDAR